MDEDLSSSDDVAVDDIASAAPAPWDWKKSQTTGNSIVKEQRETMVEVARDLTADVHNFMRNINLTVSDYISQQYMVRGSPSYKLLKDKIREYCVSLKPTGMKDDAACSVLYFVYQSLPELKRTEEADAIIRKMVGKHIRNAKYRAKCKLRDCKLTGIEKIADIVSNGNHLKELDNRAVPVVELVQTSLSRIRRSFTVSPSGPTPPNPFLLTPSLSESFSLRAQSSSTSPTSPCNSLVSSPPDDATMLPHPSSILSPPTAHVPPPNSSSGDRSTFLEFPSHYSLDTSTTQTLAFQGSFINRPFRTPTVSINDICTHQLKFISGLTYACTVCDEYFERLPTEMLVCSECKKQFTNKHLLQQHNSEAHS